MMVVIFSKDRACQLDFLLRSIQRFWLDYKKVTFSILYTYSNNSFKNGYDKVIEKFPEFTFIKENNFKEDLIRCVDKSKKYILFLCDDSVFKGHFTFEGIELNDDTICLSLRLDRGIKKNAESGEIAVPVLKDNTWFWKGCAVDWGYPMSLEAHIFHMSDIYPLLCNLDYTMVNHLEKEMVGKVDKPIMKCLRYAVTCNFILNRVQNYCANNPNGNTIPIELNADYQYGEVISFETLKNVDHSCIMQNCIKVVWE